MRIKKNHTNEFKAKVRKGSYFPSVEMLPLLTFRRRLEGGYAAIKGSKKGSVDYSKRSLCSSAHLLASERSTRENIGQAWKILIESARACARGAAYAAYSPDGCFKGGTF